MGVILATTLDPARFPAGVRAGIGAADSPSRSWRQARTALRFTTLRQPVVHYDDLGALALLAEIPQDASRDNTDETFRTSGDLRTGRNPRLLDLASQTDVAITAARHPETSRHRRVDRHPGG
ncbi:hypothetical protein [Nonomuraea sp. NPDC048901]|uniref:hypothetical protein n=1 Tax=Nonomuraea sp. NPDC048901 TaxID=3155627 RepID=UPI0033D3DDE8